MKWYNSFVHRIAKIKCQTLNLYPIKMQKIYISLFALNYLCKIANFLVRKENVTLLLFLVAVMPIYVYGYITEP